MFFTHNNRLTEWEETLAKSDRAKLVRILIKHYKALKTLYQKQKCSDVTNFLDQFKIKLCNVNNCENKTETIFNMLTKEHQKLQTDPEDKEIKDILKQCLIEIEKENGYAQTRARNLAENNLAKIKNRSIYTSSLSIAAIISGAILAVFNLPVGLIVLGITVITGILSQAIYWSSCHKKYAQLHTQIKQDVLTSDNYLYASGTAIPSEMLHLELDCALKNNNDLGEEDAKPFLFGEKADKIVDELVEAVPELLSDAVKAASAGFFKLCSNINQAVARTPATSIESLNLHLYKL